MRLLGCACCRRYWSLLEDEKSRGAVEIAERYAEGLITNEDLEHAFALATSARWEAADRDDANDIEIISNLERVRANRGCLISYDLIATFICLTVK